MGAGDGVCGIFLLEALKLPAFVLASRGEGGGGGTAVCGTNQPELV